MLLDLFLPLFEIFYGIKWEIGDVSCRGLSLARVHRISYSHGASGLSPALDYPLCTAISSDEISTYGARGLRPVSRRFWMGQQINHHLINASCQSKVEFEFNYYAKKPPFIDVTAVPHLPECSMTPRVQ